MVLQFIDRNVNMLMAALSGNPHAYNTKVEVIKGIKAIRICIINRILMDINGYYYGRSWACSGEESIFSLSSAIFSHPTPSSDNNLKEKMFTTVVIYFAIKKCFYQICGRSLYTLLCVASH